MKNTIASSMKPATNSGFILKLIEPLLTAVLLCAAFFLITSGMPLLEAGWFHELSPKNSYARTASTIFFALLALIYWRYPKELRNFKFIRFFNAVSSASWIKQAWFFFIVYFAVYGSSGILKHYALGTRAFDLGIFAQAIWNTLHGDFLFSSIKNNTNLLGDHFSPILILTVPFYALAPNPVTLIVLQALAAAACLFFIAKIAFEKTGNRFLVFTLCLLYIFYHPTRGALHEDFHPEVLAEPLLFLAFWALEKNRSKLFWGSLVVALLAKENFFGIAFIFGFYAVLFKQRRAEGLFLMTASVCLFLFEVKYLIPTIGNSRYLYEGFYKYLFSGPAAWKQVFGPDTWEYLLKVFVMFAFLPLFHLPTLLLTAPILLQNITSMNPVFRSFGYHYQTGLTPFLFIGTIYGFASLIERFPNLKKSQTPILCLLLYAGLVRSSPAPYVHFFNSAKDMLPENAIVRLELSKIPQAAVLLTHNSLIPHACHRKYVYQFEFNGTPTKLDQAGTYKADYVVFYERFWEPGTLSFDETRDSFLKAGYQIIAQKNRFLVMRKGDS